jgi:circadian clock protein KaiB
MPSKKIAIKPGKKKSPASQTAVFEELLKTAQAISHYQLRLYITGTTERSSQAIANIRSLCEEFLKGHYDLEVIDIYQQPIEAGKQQIIAAPTLVKQLPIPPKRLIGNLADRDKVLVGLNLKAENIAEIKESETKWVKV